MDIKNKLSVLSLVKSQLQVQKETPLSKICMRRAEKLEESPLGYRSCLGVAFVLAAQRINAVSKERLSIP